MTARATRILLITHNPSNRRTVCDALAEGQYGSFVVELAPNLAKGLDRLRRNGIAVILLDLCLPDSKGMAAFEQVSQAVPHVPILVIASPGDEDVAVQAVRRGAKEYLRSNQLDSYTLARALERIFERKAAHDALFLERRRTAVALNAIGEAVLATDICGNVTYLNPVAERITGWTRQDGLGQPLARVFRTIDATTREPGRSTVDHAGQLDSTTVRASNCLLVRRDGRETAIEGSTFPIHDEGGEAIGVVIVFKDVSESRAMSLQALHLAQHDALTDLPNRVLLNDRLVQAIALARRHDYPLAVLFLDLDRFKHVNDSLGYVIGDALLQSIADRLGACVRSSDTISRQGGDEFVVLLPEIGHADDAAASAQKIIGALVAPHAVAHHELHVTATIGIGIYPADGGDAATLIRSAGTAMHHGKDSGRNKYQFFERDMNARAVERQTIEAGLHRALADGEFVLHFQPKIALETGAMTGAEALIRWVHPARGLISPGDFVAIAEDCGLIVPIGQWVLREACRQARTWIDEGRRAIPLAVNISAVEFRHPGFLDNVRSVLKDSRLGGRYLELELTESSLFQHPESTAFVLQGLKKLGVQVAIDDFGTGYSSLSYLRRFPVSVLKIDQSFVQEINADPVGSPIVSAVINMGNSLGHRVIAEGVETGEQLAFLQGQRCAEGQGYYFSPPLAAEQFVKLLDSDRPGLVLQ
jgi:diguanylate cyclase (GGDEF)-like protein/PAS domain S-box-containing protein